MEHNKSVISNASLISSSTTTKSKYTLEDFAFVQQKGKLTSELGKGAFGIVKLVRSRLDDKLYALKTINKMNLVEYSSTKHLKREIKI